MFTILGTSGFIGSHLVEHLGRLGARCYCPTRDTDLSSRDLGDVIYCIGLTADFRKKPLETIEAHVCCVIDILRNCQFDSFLYLSSTRVYGTRPACTNEEAEIRVEPLEFDDVYNISKVMGESACFSSGARNVHVARLSNVYGYDSKSENFIFTLIRDAITKHEIVLNSTLDSEKDHVCVSDVTNILPKIAKHGKYAIYNIANGTNTKVGAVVDRIKEITGCSVRVSNGARRVVFPKMNTNRAVKEFYFSPSSIVDDLESLIEEYKKHEGAKQ